MSTEGQVDPGTLMPRVHLRQDDKQQPRTAKDKVGGKGKEEQVVTPGHATGATG